MTLDEWIAKYKPVRNIHRRDRPLGGRMFETHGIEIQTITDIHAREPLRVWTLLECSKPDSWVLVNGYHVINRVGYFVTQKPFVPSSDMPVLEMMYLNFESPEPA